MSSPAPRTEPKDIQAEDAEYFRGILHDLIERGADLAKRIHEQAIAPAAEGADPTPITPQHIAAFERVARTVRRTILLAQKIAQPPPRPAPAHDPAQLRAAARKRIIREVEDAIQGEAWMEKSVDAPALQAEFLDRLDSLDLDEEIDLRAVPDIVKDILRDLGLAHIKGLHHPWKRRTPDDIASLCARAAEPRSTHHPQTIRPGHPSPPPVKLSTG